jgi:alcohol dehydrogenase (cytochrome c)
MGLPFALLPKRCGAQAQQGADPIRNITPVTDECCAIRRHRLADVARTYDGWGYSPLDQINKTTSRIFSLAWTWSMTNGATETTPIVHDGVSVLINYADKIQALDGRPATDSGNTSATCRPSCGLAAICSPAQHGDLEATIDRRDLPMRTSIALDAKTGKVVVGPPPCRLGQGLALTSGPFIAHGMIVQGMPAAAMRSRAAASSPGTTPRPARRVGASTIAHPGDPN